MYFILNDVFTCVRVYSLSAVPSEAKRALDTLELKLQWSLTSPCGCKKHIWGPLQEQQMLLAGWTFSPAPNIFQLAGINKNPDYILLWQKAKETFSVEISLKYHDSIPVLDQTKQLSELLKVSKKQSFKKKKQNNFNPCLIL